MNTKLSLIIVICLPFIHSFTSKKIKNEAQKIIIEVNLTTDYYNRIVLPNSSLRDSIEIQYQPLFQTGFDNDTKISKARIENGQARWILYTTEVLEIKNFDAILVSPGDSIYITNQGNELFYSGRGSDKFNLWKEIINLDKKLPRPTKNSRTITGVEDYLSWNRYLDDKVYKSIQIIEHYKDRVQQHEYDFIKTYIIQAIEYERTTAFLFLKDYNDRATSSKLNIQSLNLIWDTTQYKSWAKWLRSYSNYHGPMGGFYDFHRQEVRRKFNFDFSHDSLESKELRTLLYYKHAKTNYKGLLRERLMAFILDEQTITEMGPQNQMTRFMLQDYYDQSGYPEYKNWIKEKEINSRKLREGKQSPDFILIDRDGKFFTKDSIRGKVALMNFMVAGIDKTMQQLSKWNKLAETFQYDTNVVFMLISPDTTNYIQSKKIAGNLYKNVIHLYSGINSHELLKTFNISENSLLLLLDEDGRVSKWPIPDIKSENGIKELTGLIKKTSAEKTKKEYAMLYDGPYIIYNQNDVIINYILPINKVRGTKKITKKISARPQLELQICTDEPGKTFSVKLKKELVNEPSIFEHASKQFVVSDIEGNFDAFRKLLQANHIIDQNFNWIFGSGHLVLVGDFFDRGIQVTEVLWLIYSLEEKAKKAGGYIHFILGNHEIMNLNNDLRYVKGKYIANAKLLNVAYSDLFSSDSELGRWLRTKNIVEKIGSILYVHGGISPQVNRLPLTITQINSLAHKNYVLKNDSISQEAATLIGSKTSPLWFRGYYEDNPDEVPTLQQLDSTLLKFTVTRIITGHTVAADTISTWYATRIINVDSRHDRELSEALFIYDANKFYRVNTEGEKKLLFTDTSNSLLTQKETRKQLNYKKKLATIVNN